MSKTVWTSDEVQKQFHFCVTLGDVIRSLENQFRKNNEVLCSVTANGLRLSENDETRLASCKLHEITSLEIETSSPRELILETVKSTEHLMGNISRRAQRVAEEFRENLSPAACRGITGVTEGLREIFEAVQNIQSVGFNVVLRETLATEKFAVQSNWQDQVDKTKACIQSMLNAFEKKDTILLADILEYDVEDLGQEWNKLFAQLCHLVDTTNCDSDIATKSESFIQTWGNLP